MRLIPFVFIISSLFHFSTLSYSQIEGDQGLYSLAALQVRTEQVFAFTLNNEGTATDSLLFMEVSYNGEGASIRKVYFDHEGNKVREISNEYSNDGNLQNQTISHSGLKRNQAATWEYDSEGRKKRYVLTENDTKIIEDEGYVYNDMGQLIEAYAYVPGESPVRVESYTYNDDGRLSKTSFYRNGSEYYSMTENQYDDAGNLISSWSTGLLIPSQPKLLFSYAYDDAGRCIRKSSPMPGQGSNYDPSDPNSGRSVVYEYDDEGLLIREITLVKGKEVSLKRHYYTRSGTN